MIPNLFPEYKVSSAYSFTPKGPSIMFKDIDSLFVKQILRFIAKGNVVIKDAEGNKLEVRLG